MILWIRNFLSKEPKPLMPEASVEVIDHGEFVSTSFPNGDTQTLSWSELTRIEIHTDDSGPWRADFWWFLYGSRDHVFYPQGATGEQNLIDRLLSLPEFDNEEFVKACACTDVARFLCWESGGTD